MGHADPRTTRRCMATHQHLDRHATYAFAARLRRTPRSEHAEHRGARDERMFLTWC
jgi:hypothetical protein